VTLKAGVRDSSDQVRSQAPLWRVSLARDCWEAINNFTPTANIGENRSSLSLAHHGLTTDAGLASIVAAKTALTISQSPLFCFY